MASIPIQTQHRTTDYARYPEVVAIPSRQVRVGATSVARYATWDDHRRQIRQLAEQARAGRSARYAS